MCEQVGMEKPRVKQLVEAVRISKGYASDILNSKQAPSRPLAIHIFQATGWKHSSIADLSPAQLDMLANIDPWTPVSERAA